MSLVQRPSVLESCKLDNSSLWIIRRLRALPEIRLSFLKCGGCYTRGTPSFRSTERFNTERRGREKEPVDFPAIHSRNQGLVFAFERANQNGWRAKRLEFCIRVRPSRV